MIKSLRLQLTVWHLAFFASLFVLFCLLFYGALARSLERELDASLISKTATAAELVREELEESQGDAHEAAATVLSGIESRSLAAVLENGRLVAVSGAHPITGLEPGLSQFLAAKQESSVWALPNWDHNGAHLAARKLVYENRAFAVLVLEPLDRIAQQLRTVREILWLAVPPLLALAALGGYWLTRRGLQPLQSIVEQTREITGDSLDKRIEIGHAADELALLAASFNELLSRLDQSFQGMRRFVQDASHEIRTPLAVIRGEADVALSRDRSAAEHRESLEIIQEESRRLSRLVDDLLNLARADAGHVQLHVEPLYLNDLLAECCRSVQPLAAAREIRLEFQAERDITIEGDEQLLRRMIINLLDNAIRYTPAGGRVSADVEVIEGDVRIRVADTGIGIDNDAVPHVFERFYRVDKARSRQQGGFGLGLSIVQWIAEAHRGVVELASQPGVGTTFTVRLQK
jgi:heavy metal sensor kinase